jgi:hypothetical protein
MAWKNYTPSLATTPPPSAVSLTIPPPKSNTPTLLIDQATADALGWTTATALAIAIGEGEDFGKIRIWPRHDAPSTLRKPNGAHYSRLRLLLGRAPCLSTTPWRGPVDFTIEPVTNRPATLVITLPEPARAKPAAAVKTPPPEEKPARPQARVVPRRLEDDGHQLPPATAAAVRRAMGASR